MHQRHVEMVAEEGDDFGGFVLAHQPRIDENAGQLLPNRGVQKRGDDG